MTRLGAHELIDVLVDEGSWTSWDGVLAAPAASAEYVEQLARARARTGLDEAVLTGAASIRGRRIAMLVCDFGFLGGSIGIGASDRLATAILDGTIAEGDDVTVDAHGDQLVLR